MNRRTLNVLALAVVALGGTALAHPATASADDALVTCTKTVTRPDGTVITTTASGTTCTVDASGNCTCT
jgi:hypothetical protein